MIRKRPRITTASRVLERLDAVLQERKLAGLPHSDRAISLAATGSTDTLRSLRRGVTRGTQGGISTSTLEGLAKAVGKPVDYFLAEDSPEIHVDPFERAQYAEAIEAERLAVIGTVPLVGYVGAGATAHYYEGIAPENLDRVPAPINATDSTVAVEIRGISLGSMFDRWLVYYDDVRRPVTHDLIGQLCVVGTDDGRILVKKLKRSKTRVGTFDLISEVEPPIEGVSVQWAAKVRQLAPQ